ncbi:hypothetical protein ACS5PJ_13280 [Pseudarthrobacter sp. YS3]|uniref:hypothetical protein n=1 Tax=Pseudarthrobacter sp. YS3 TaxID=3453718 RepID=UPI003EEF68EB
MNAPSSPVITRSLSRTVDDMLLDAGETDARLRSALLSLGSLRSLPVPEPGAELAALLLTGPADQLARQRLLRRHRNSVVGLAVIAGMGLGVTGVAASGSVPDGSTNSSVQQMLADWSPAWTITGTPLASPADGGLSGEMRGPGGPAPADQAGRDGAAGQPETSGPGSNQPGSTGQGTSRQETTHQQKATGNGQGDNSSSKNGDDGAADFAVNGNSDGSGAGDAASGDGREEAGNAGSEEAGSEEAGSDGAGGQGNHGKPAALTSTLEAVTSLAQTGKTVAGKTDPGLIWLKKFSR